eukprot:4456568-Prymnesium_polylepis.2
MGGPHERAATRASPARREREARDERPLALARADAAHHRSDSAGRRRRPDAARRAANEPDVLRERRA